MKVKEIKIGKEYVYRSNLFGAMRITATEVRKGGRVVGTVTHHYHWNKTAGEFYWESVKPSSVIMSVQFMYNFVEKEVAV